MALKDLVFWRGRKRKKDVADTDMAVGVGLADILDSLSDGDGDGGADAWLAPDPQCWIAAGACQ